MKKTVFKDTAAYSVAMSQETGCIVMVRTTGQKVAIMGSLTREDSVKFAESVTTWIPESIRAAYQQIEPPRTEEGSADPPKLQLVN